MKLATFEHQGRQRIGAVVDDGVIDLSGEPGFPASMEALLEDGADGLTAAHAAADRGRPIPLTEVRLRAPVTSPRKFLAIAANYQSHIDEVLRVNPDYVPPVHQRWFNKQTTCIAGPYDPIPFPPEAKELDYEAELAVIIGRRCRRVPADRAAEVVAGYTVCNDVSVRDWQRTSPTITLGKSFDGHGPLGPWLVTADEIEDPHGLRITCTVNGEARQSGSTSEMINSVWEQIAWLSTVFTLEPGDVIATGTPVGTGAGHKPPRLLNVGDVVRCEVERIGAIEATVVAEPL